MEIIDLINSVITICFVIMTYRRIGVVQVVIYAIAIYLFAHGLSSWIVYYFDNIDTSNILIKSLVDSLKPFTLDSVWGEANPTILGLLCIAVVKLSWNKFRAFITRHAV